MSDHRFLECKNEDSESENKWFRHCESHCIPFVVVRHRNKYAEVHWDCISLAYGADAVISENGHAVCDQLSELFHRFASKKSKCQYSAYTGSFDNLERGNAVSAAAQVFDILARCGKMAKA